MSRSVSDSAAFAAVDLGASSGRVMLGRVGPDGVKLAEAHRFANRPVTVSGTLCWDILALYQGVLDGLAAAGRVAGRLSGIGIDSWAVDYGLLDADGALLGNPVHHRDRRTDGVPDRVAGTVPPAELYARTGIQFAPLNTIYQLAASAGSPALRAARQLMLIPDLMSYWLTGVAGTEVTNASTTQLLDVDGSWADDIAGRLGIDLGLFPPLRHPGEPAGSLVPEVLAETGLRGPVPVYTVGSHDTASAVAGVPATTERFAYISCGTWSLVGVELDRPVLTGQSRQANFTNELGVDGTVRYLRNVTGLWLLQECLRAWRHDGHRVELAELLREAAGRPALRSVVDATGPEFVPPGGMPGRIADACRRAGEPVPASPAGIVRCIVDSLALAYRTAVADAQRLSGQAVDVVHIVGGGAHNELLCQLTADACGLPVIAGPAEAAAFGNVVVQARAAGLVSGGLAELRALVAAGEPLRRYEPAAAGASWLEASRRLGPDGN